MYALFLMFFATVMHAMEGQQQNNQWDLNRYFETKELVRWGKTERGQAENYISEGRDIWDEIVKGNYKQADNLIFDSSSGKLINSKSELLKRVAVCWYLYSKALEQDKPFYNGMFVIHDTHNEDVYNFFYEYVKNTIDKEHENPVYYSTNPFSYARHSTHFKQDKEQNTEYGIEVRYEKNQWSSHDLPSGCSHILFGKLKKNDQTPSRMFLKMEDMGLYFVEISYHVGGIMGSYARKVLPYLLGVSIASKIITLNDGKFCQKEHMPSDVYALYYKTCIENNIIPQKLHTIAQIWNYAQEQTESFQELREFLEKNYSDLKSRFGNEIIIKTAL